MNYRRRTPPNRCVPNTNKLSEYASIWRVPPFHGAETREGRRLLLDDCASPRQHNPFGFHEAGRPKQTSLPSTGVSTDQESKFSAVRCLRHDISISGYLIEKSSVWYLSNMALRHLLAKQLAFPISLNLNMRFSTLLGLVTAILPFCVEATTTWKNVKIGGGGGFVPGIVFSKAKKGVAFARTDIGGLYRLNSDDSWTPLLDWADNARWNYWGVDALALHPTDSNIVYAAVGMYTNSWDPNNGHILRSADLGNTWTAYPLSFKVGGNMPGRGVGERLAVDPNLPTTLYFGARSGNGLWKSTDSGATWTKQTLFPSVGTYVQDASSEYTADIVGISWVTFDKGSGTSGTATPRIFVGVANLGSTNIYVTTNGGTSWSALAGQPTTYIPHKGVISPSDNLLYISYANAAGPYDGTLGAVWKYNIATAVWTDITPVTGSDLYFGFGGLDVDLQKPGTIMVASLNSWWPDGQIYRSIDSGATWSPLWAWNGYPNISKYYGYDVSLAPWIGVVSSTETKQIGWMMESLSIDPFDSNHWLYGTGLTVYGGHDLLNWDTTHNITLKSLADGIEEFAILGLISPPTGPNLVSAVGDVGGFVHTSLTTAPTTQFINPMWATTLDIDYAGNKPTNFVRIGNDATSGESKQVALSSDSGATWSQDYGAADLVSGGKVAISADADVVLWRTGSNGVQVSRYTNAFTAVSTLPSDAAIASDKLTNSNFYGASGSKFYVSIDFGVTFAASAGSLGSATTSNDIVVHPTVTGDIWVSTNVGLFHTTNTGATFSQISGFTEAWSISVGAPKTTGGYPSIYAIGTYGGVTGVYRTDDAGLNWIQLDDTAHRFGAASANVISGDRRIYGRVYVGTNGRGIFYGDVSGTDATASVTASSSASTSKTSSVSTTKSTTSSSSVSTTKTTTSSSSSTSKASTTVSTTTTKTSTSTSSASTATQTAYGQCGGSNYTGPTICPTGWTCKYSSDFYSQCLQ